MFDGFDDEPWYIRWLLHVRVAWLPYCMWPLLVVTALVLGLMIAGCHLHLHVGERHVHRTNEPAKAANVLDDILERLGDVQEDMDDKDVQTDGSSDSDGTGS